MSEPLTFRGQLLPDGRFLFIAPDNTEVAFMTGRHIVKLVEAPDSPRLQFPDVAEFPQVTTTFATKDITCQLAERGWQPIETAPGDRIHVDLWAGRRIPNAYWSEELGDWMADGLGLLKWCSARPTHWMPLPHPPEPAGEEPSQSISQ